MMKKPTYYSSSSLTLLVISFYPYFVFAEEHLFFKFPVEIFFQTCGNQFKFL